MPTTMWVICGIAVATLLGGIVATIVVKVDSVPNWRKVTIVLYWIIGLLLFKLVACNLIVNYRDRPGKMMTASNKVTTVQPKEEWVFSWKLPPGEMSIGRNSHTLEVEITKNDQDSLWAVLHDKKNGIDVSVGGLRLGKVGNDLIGTWTNYLDGDGGKCYLYNETGYSWSGNYGLKDGSQTHCTLKRK